MMANFIFGLEVVWHLIYLRTNRTFNCIKNLCVLGNEIKKYQNWRFNKLDIFNFKHCCYFGFNDLKTLLDAVIY